LKIRPPPWVISGSATGVDLVLAIFSNLVYTTLSFPDLSKSNL